MSDMPPPPPPPPPPSGDAAASSPGGSVDIGKALAYAWKKFSANPVNWILLALIPFLALAFSYVLQFLLSRNGFTGLLLGWFFSIVFYLVALIVQYGLVRAALLTTEGREVSPGDAWKDTSRLGNYIIASILVALLSMVGLILCCVGTLIVTFFAWFTPFFVIDRGMAPVDAIKASFQLVSKHIGKLILFLIVVILLYFIGGVVCFVGLLVTMPLALIATAFVYKDMTGQPVAPLS
jgi:uncharacterized membrane protein